MTNNGKFKIVAWSVVVLVLTLCMITIAFAMVKYATAIELDTRYEVDKDHAIIIDKKEMKIYEFDAQKGRFVPGGEKNKKN